MVDMRASIHEKAVLIDDEVLRTALNPLSYAGQTSESMLRIPARCLYRKQKNRCPR